MSDPDGPSGPSGPSSPSSDDEVPKLPRGRGMKLSTAELFRIVLTLAMLIAIIALARPCGNAVSNFVMGFGTGTDQPASKLPRPDNVEVVAPKPDAGMHYVEIGGDMTPEQREAAVKAEQQRARAAANGSAGRSAP
ncbi:MAG TPA: hypothetical protein VLX92_29720 [Kofleriaceae bacterium]|nr:hypothetical protein [Kofleriaceae bacterium]